MRRASLAIVLSLACGGCTERLEVLHGLQRDAPPDAIAVNCDLPARPSELTALPSNPVGNGTPESCTAAALTDRLAAGGMITFQCGAGPFSLSLDAELAINVNAVLDGGERIDGTPRITLRATNSRVLAVHSSSDATPTRVLLKNLGIEGGRGVPGRSDDDTSGGGAIFDDRSEVIVEDCVLSHNSSPTTGGAIGGRGRVVIVRSQITDNHANNGGGVGLGAGEVALFDSTVASNRADKNGGGVYVAADSGRTTICRSTLSANIAAEIAGGLYVSDIRHGVLLVQESAVLRNRAGDSGSMGKAGGVYTQGAEVAVLLSSIAENRAAMAAGMWTGAFIAPSQSNLIDVAGTLTLENVTIAGNQNDGSQAGGGLWLVAPVSGDVEHCTIVNNRAGTSAAIGGASEGVSVMNSILVNQSERSPINCANSHGRVSALNLQYPIEMPPFPCAPEITFADPLIDPLGDYGGGTPTVRLRAGSPAALAATACPATDQRGRPRPRRCALGAYEPD